MVNTRRDHEITHGGEFESEGSKFLVLLATPRNGTVQNFAHPSPIQCSCPPIKFLVTRIPDPWKNIFPQLRGKTRTTFQLYLSLFKKFVPKIKATFGGGFFFVCLFLALFISLFMLMWKLLATTLKKTY